MKGDSVRPNSSSHLGLKQAVTLPETGDLSRPPHASCRSEAQLGKGADDQIKLERGAFAESPREQNIDQMLKKFRRQDRVTKSTVAAVFVTLFATLAVWGWHYSQ
jgi:hypothetical protein